MTITDAIKQVMRAHGGPMSADDAYRAIIAANLYEFHADDPAGIVRNQIPKIFAKLLYGSKFHRLRMSRGQQGIGISAAGMYGQLTTGASTRILSKVKGSKNAHHMEVQIDTRANKPSILTDEEAEWLPIFQPVNAEGKPGKPIEYKHGTCVEIVMEAAYVRGRLSVDEYIKQCAIVNPHLQLHYRLALKQKSEDRSQKSEVRGKQGTGDRCQGNKEPRTPNQEPGTR